MHAVLNTLRQRSFLCLLAIYAGVCLMNGPAFADIDDYFQIAADPFRIGVSVDRQFLYSSPLNFVLAHVLGLVSFPGFIALHAAEIIGLCCVAVAVRKKIQLLSSRRNSLSFCP